MHRKFLYFPNKLRVCTIQARSLTLLPPHDAPQPRRHQHTSHPTDSEIIITPTNSRKDELWSILYDYRADFRFIFFEHPSRSRPKQNRWARHVIHIHSPFTSPRTRLLSARARLARTTACRDLPTPLYVPVKQQSQRCGGVIDDAFVPEYWCATYIHPARRRS